MSFLNMVYIKFHFDKQIFNYYYKEAEEMP